MNGSIKYLICILISAMLQTCTNDTLPEDYEMPTYACFEKSPVEAGCGGFSFIEANFHTLEIYKNGNLIGSEIMGSESIDSDCFSGRSYIDLTIEELEISTISVAQNHTGDCGVEIVFKDKSITSVRGTIDGKISNLGLVTQPAFTKIEAGEYKFIPLRD